jgi:hypothetical protein
MSALLRKPKALNLHGLLPPFGLLDVLRVRLRGPSVRGPRIFGTFDFLVTGFMNNPG